MQSAAQEDEKRPIERCGVADEIVSVVASAVAERGAVDQAEIETRAVAAIVNHLRGRVSSHTQHWHLEEDPEQLLREAGALKASPSVAEVCRGIAQECSDALRGAREDLAAGRTSVPSMRGRGPKRPRPTGKGSKSRSLFAADSGAGGSVFSLFALDNLPPMVNFGDIVEKLSEPAPEEDVLRALRKLDKDSAMDLEGSTLWPSVVKCLGEQLKAGMPIVREEALSAHKRLFEALQSPDQRIEVLRNALEAYEVLVPDSVQRHGDGIFVSAPSLERLRAIGRLVGSAAEILAFPGAVQDAQLEQLCALALERLVKPSGGDLAGAKTALGMLAGGGSWLPQWLRALGPDCTRAAAGAAGVMAALAADLCESDSWAGEGGGARPFSAGVDAADGISLDRRALRCLGKLGSARHFSHLLRSGLTEWEGCDGLHSAASIFGCALRQLGRAMRAPRTAGASMQLVLDTVGDLLESLVPLLPGDDCASGFGRLAEECTAAAEVLQDKVAVRLKCAHVLRRLSHAARERTDSRAPGAVCAVAALLGSSAPACAADDALVAACADLLSTLRAEDLGEDAGATAELVAAILSRASACVRASVVAALSAGPLPLISAASSSPAVHAFIADALCGAGAGGAHRAALAALLLEPECCEVALDAVKALAQSPERASGSAAQAAWRRPRATAGGEEGALLRALSALAPLPYFSDLLAEDIRRDRRNGGGGGGGGGRSIGAALGAALERCASSYDGAAQGSDAALSHFCEVRATLEALAANVDVLCALHEHCAFAAAYERLCVALREDLAAADERAAPAVPCGADTAARLRAYEQWLAALGRGGAVDADVVRRDAHCALSAALPLSAPDARVGVALCALSGPDGARGAAMVLCSVARLACERCGAPAGACEALLRAFSAAEAPSKCLPLMPYERQVRHADAAAARLRRRAAALEGRLRRAGASAAQTFLWLVRTAVPSAEGAVTLRFLNCCAAGDVHEQLRFLEAALLEMAGHLAEASDAPGLRRAGAGAVVQAAAALRAGALDRRLGAAPPSPTKMSVCEAIG